MTEPSKDKTKRNYIRELLVYPWKFQTTIYFCLEGSQFALEEMEKIKRRMRKNFKEPFLFRTQLFNQARGKTVVLVTIFSLSESTALKDHLEGWLSSDRYDNVKTREITEAMRLDMAKTIRIQSPHNLKKFFNKKKVNRFASIGEKYLPESDTTLYARHLISFSKEAD